MTGQGTPHHTAVHLVRAAVTAPSLHNSQPWLFAYSDGQILLYADGRRRVALCDPDGRQLVVSCGAALFNLRLAMRHLGFSPAVQLLPNSRVPALLARVAFGAYAGVTPTEELMHRALRQRHTHRGPFQDTALPASLVESLRQHARAEGAELCTLEGSSDRRRLGELVREAETLERAASEYGVELGRWIRASQDRRPDGIPAEACAVHPDCTALAGRDFTGLTLDRATVEPPWRLPARTGLMAVLTTPHDTRQDWLYAGQALQRVLLHAAAHDVVAGFHTQPLEFPGLRARLRLLVPSGRHPQMVLRLGRVNWHVRTPRRSVADVLSYGSAARAATG